MRLAAGGWWRWLELSSCEFYILGSIPPVNRGKGERSWSLGIKVMSVFILKLWNQHHLNTTLKQSGILKTKQNKTNFIFRLLSVLLVTKNSAKVMENNANDKMYLLLYVSSVLCISNASVYLILTKILRWSRFHIFTKVKTKIDLRSNFLKSSSLSFHSIK